MKEKKQLYLIKWVDSAGAEESYWKRLSEVSMKDVFCLSVGWIIKETKTT